MSCWVIIPVKPPGEGKQRLAGALDDAARTRLVGAMLDAVLDAVSAARFVDRICIVGTSRHGQSTAIPLLDDSGGGLNAALTEALGQAEAGGATRVVFIAADLPRITPRDVESLAGAPDGTVAIAPDRHGTGTNAIALPLPQAGGFTFAYGTDSFAKHDAEAYRLGLDIEIIASPGLARDGDVPEDLRDAPENWSGIVWGE
jgi:2-phospho-L-lactate guanylyltransferase